MNNYNKSRKADDSFDLKSYLDRVIADWWILILSFLLCMSSVLLFLKYKTPMYRIDAQILIEDEKKGGGVGLNASDMFGDLGSLMGMKNNVDNEVEVLKSRALMEKVVRKQNLNISYFNKGLIKDAQIYAAPFIVEVVKSADSTETTKFNISFIDSNSFELAYSNQLDKQSAGDKLYLDQIYEVIGVGAIRIKRNPNGLLNSNSEYAFAITSVDAAVEALQKEMTVGVTNKLVTTIDISLNFPVAKKGEEILARLIDEYSNQNILDKNQIADSTISFIENRLMYVSKELGDVEGDIQNFKQWNKIADIGEQSKLLVTNTSDFLKQLAAVEAQINVIQSLEDNLNKEDHSNRVVPSSVLPQDLVFGRLVENYNLLLLERDRQTVASTEENPFIKNLEERIVTLRNTILINLSNAKKNFLINKAQIQKDMNKLDSGIRAIPSQERAYLDLARQQRIKQELYLFLMQKREEVAISKTSNIANSKIIDAPKSESKPFSPNKPIIIVFGFVIAILLPFLRIFIIDNLNNKVQSKEDITKATIIPVVGEISHNDTTQTLVVTTDQRSPIAEQFRALRTNLQFFTSAQKNKTILLTSSMSGEGKSFSAANLGAILAISGKKILMMELDLRKPNLSASLGIKNNIGFTNYIITPELKPSDIIFPTGAHENLFIISSGPLPPNPAETLLSERMEQLMYHLKDQFDYIILDAPPIGLVTDAQLLNKYAMLTLYVVRQKYTMKAQLEIADELHRNSKVDNIGIVLNGVKNSRRYGAYGAYGHYGQDVKQKGWLADISIKFKSKA